MSTAETENNSKDFRVIKNYINNKTIALDIGACIGNFTKFLAKNCKQVYAFEPSPDNYDRLEENTKEFENVFLFNIAIGDKNSTSFLYLCPQDIGMNRLYPSKWCKGGKRFKVITRRIDDITSRNKIDFIKMDVEGYEYFATMGMKNILERDHPTIMMEFHPPSMEEAGSYPEQLYNFMIHIMKYKQPLIVDDLRIKIKSYADLDYICRNKAAVNIIFTS